jgi:hypothetical protein
MSNKIYKIPGDVMSKILRDITMGVTPENSRLEYTPEMLEFRAECTREFENHLEINPDAELHAPEDLPE